jgi:hypothetical protein
MYSTDDLVQRAVQALRKMQKVEAAKVSFTTAELSVTNAGVERPDAPDPKDVAGWVGCKVEELLWPPGFNMGPHPS